MQIDFSGSHAISKGLSDLGAGMGRLGRDMQDDIDRQKDADRAVYGARWQATAAKTFDAALTEMENTPFEDIDQGKFKKMQQIRESLLQDVEKEPDDRLRKLKASTYYTLDAAAAKAETDLLGKKRRDWGRAGLAEGTEAALVSFYQESDTEGRRKIMDDHLLKVVAAREGGILSEQEAQQHVIKFNEATLTLTADGMIRSNQFDQASQFVEKNRIMLGNQYGQLVGKIDRQKAEVVEAVAYAEASLMWSEPKTAVVEVLKPEFMKKHGLSMNQAQNIAQSFNAIGAQREREGKERQDKNLDQIRGVAINNPTQALKMIRTAQDVDPKEALALQGSLESHLRQMSLMGAQEKSLRMDLEDKMKASIKSKILSGGFKSEQEVTNAVIAEGFTNTSGFIDDALGTFRGFKKDVGSVNYFQQANEDWDRLIQTTKGSKKKRELQDMKPKVLETIRQQMEKEGLRVSDPKVFELYQKNRKALTETWFQKSIESVGSFFGGSGDSFVTPAAVPKPAVGPVMMDETTARKRLADKNVTGPDQDRWIKRYREEGVIK